MITTSEIAPDLEQVPEIFTRHIGTWKGEYIKTDQQGHFSRSFVGSFTIAIAGNQYQQVNKYEYADKDGVFDGISFIEEMRIA